MNDDDVSLLSWAGVDEAEQCFKSQKVIAVNAISGELIGEKRGIFIEK